MSHPLLAAVGAAPAVASAEVARPAAWAARPALGPQVAILITEGRDVAAAVRGYRTVLPRARVFLYGHDLSPEAVSRAEAAGATVRPGPASTRQALIRRMFAEVDADVLVLAHGAGPEDVCVAPLVVAEIAGGGKELVDVRRFGEAREGDAGDRLLARIVDFLFGQGGDVLASDFKACSRRFALSYRDAARRDAPGHPAALDLALHALRLRLPIGRVAALSGPPAPATPPRARSLADWARLLGLVARLLTDERPRRLFGLAGLFAMAAGISATLPALTIHHGLAVLPLHPSTLATLGLVAAGGGLGLAGLLLDTLAAARQEVRRLAYGSRFR